MKRLILNLVLLSLPLAVFGQTANSTETMDSTNVYYQAFKLYCSELDSAKNFKLNVEENNLTTSSLPTQIGSFHINIIDIFRLQKQLKKLGSLILIRIVPMRIKSGVFFINIIPFRVVKTEEGINYINSGGATIRFNYDCQGKHFILISNKDYSL